MAKITFVNKLENEGATPEGKVFAVDMNEIKSVINTNEDLRLGQTPTSGVYSIGSQSLVFRNAANAIVFSVSLSDLVVGGGGGIADAPDSKRYVRTQGSWVEATLFTDAPNNTSIYGRSGGAWSIITPGISEAPDDGGTYGRKNKAWIAISSSGGGVSVHNDLTGRGETGCHPISAITDLQTTLAGKAALAGNINQDFSAKVLTVGNSIVLNGRSLTIRTL